MSSSKKSEHRYKKMVNKIDFVFAIHARERLPPGLTAFARKCQNRAFAMVYGKLSITIWHSA